MIRQKTLIMGPLSGRRGSRLDGLYWRSSSTVWTLPEHRCAGNVPKDSFCFVEARWAHVTQSFEEATEAPLWQELIGVCASQQSDKS
jgi:hypothetical protein